MQEVTIEEIGLAAQRLAERLETAAAKGEPYSLTPGDLKDLAVILRSIAQQSFDDVKGADRLVVG